MVMTKDMNKMRQRNTGTPIGMTYCERACEL